MRKVISSALGASALLLVLGAAAADAGPRCGPHRVFVHGHWTNHHHTYVKGYCRRR